jgi:flagellar basal body L-ring protein FlgH
MAVMAMAGCSTLEEVEQAALPPPLPQKKIVQRELGSLWSEDSMWNHVYTAASARVVGDIISIRLDEAFQNRVAKLKPESRNEEAAAAGAATPKSAGDIVLRGTIEDVGARGVYRISASDTLRMGNWEPYLILKGRVRDRDINAVDEVSVASVVDLGFELLRNPPVAGDAVKGENHVSW